MRKVYIAGPMTHIPQFNFPAFDEAARVLRASGFEVVTPTELDDPAARQTALQSKDGDPDEYQRITGLTWADFLSRDVKLIADGGFGTIFCLPGWEKSRGALLETFVAYLNHIDIWTYDPDLWATNAIDATRLAEVWKNLWNEEVPE